MINKITLTLLCVGLVATGASAQQMKLIAKAKAMGPSEATQDSIIYFHSGTKGNNPPGKYNIPEFRYMEDSNRVFGLDGGNIVVKSKNVFYYTGNDVDSIITYELNNGTWENDSKTYVQYASGKPDTVFHYSWSTFGGNSSWRESSRDIYTWSGNNFATHIYQTRSFGGGGGGPQWRNRRKYTVTYSSGMESVYIDAKWDSNNNKWEDSFKRETTYAAGKISQIDNSLWDGSTWKDNDKEIYSYDGQGRLETVNTEFLNSGSWVKNDLYTYYYTGATPNPDSMTHVNNTFGNTPPQYINQTKHVYAANSANQRVEERVESWDGTGAYQYAGSDTTLRWYYGWNVNVEEVKTSENKILIYPSPANDVINLVVDGAYSKGEVEFAIVNMQGRVVKSWKDRDAKTATVTVRELPAGNYILKLSNSNQSRSERFSIVK